jgi:acyl-coenzyme A thioesterase PaaI-like protein
MRREPVRGGVPEPSFESLPGMERARAILLGLVPRPPLSHLLGLRLVQVGAGTATMSMPATPWLQMPNGQLLYSALVEAAATIAVLTGAPSATDVNLTGASVNFFARCTPQSETVIARARVLNS